MALSAGHIYRLWRTDELSFNEIWTSIDTLYPCIWNGRHHNCGSITLIFTLYYLNKSLLLYMVIDNKLSIYKQSWQMKDLTQNGQWNIGYKY